MRRSSEVICEDVSHFWITSFGKDKCRLSRNGRLSRMNVKKGNCGLIFLKDETNWPNLWKQAQQSASFSQTVSFMSTARRENRIQYLHFSSQTENVLFQCSFDNLWGEILTNVRQNIRVTKKVILTNLK